MIRVERFPMLIKRTVLLFSSICMLWFGALAQGTLQFDETTYDFGLVYEMDGKVSHTFSFVNTGPDSVQLKYVKASCGCTTPAWTREKVAPGDSGMIVATYNPRNRPGPFKKSLTINAGLAQGPAKLYIQGKVTPKLKRPEERMKYRKGDFFAISEVLAFGGVTTEKVVTRTFDIFNNSDSALRFSEAAFLVPDHVSVQADSMVAPKSMGKMEVSYLPLIKNGLGYKVYAMEIILAGDTIPFEVAASVEEYFPPMTEEELEESPKLYFDRDMHDFKGVQQGSVLSTRFTLTNTGRETLHVRDVQTNCPCTVAELPKRKIKPGKSVDMDVIFDTQDRVGRQFKMITVFSNDPSAPTQMLTVKADLH